VNPVLPQNMGGLHRLAYLVIGVGTIVLALAATGQPRAARLGLGIMGVMALASSLSGFCVTCHTFGVTTQDNRLRRLP
jgi:Protein of unknown function (DUF2892)